MTRTASPGLPAVAVGLTGRRSRYLALTAMLIVAQPMFASASAAPAARTQEGPWRNVDHVTFSSSQIEVVPGRVAELQSMLKGQRHGVYYSPEELAILDAFNAGLSVSNIEADVLISRALYHQAISKAGLSEAQTDLLARYMDYTKTNAAGLYERRAALHARYGIAIQPPDDSHDWELYSNPEKFNELDGLARILEHKYGKKGGLSLRDTREPSALQSVYSIPEFAFIGSPENFLVNDPDSDPTDQDTQSETSILYLPGGGLVAAFNDSGNYFYGYEHFTGWSTSPDGRNWKDKGELPATPGDFGDPVLARSSTTGTVILATLAGNSPHRLHAFRSTDGGQTFNPNPADGTGGAGGSGFVHDKEWVTCDNFPETGGVGRGGSPPSGTFYMFWRDFGPSRGMTFTRSTDDGLTWTNRQILQSGGQGAFPVVGADHAVYAFWLGVDPTATFRQIQFRKSTDRGVSFAPRLPAANLRTVGTNGNLGLTGGFRTNAFPAVVAHPLDPNQLFMVYNDHALAPPDRANIYLTQTADGGATWSAPVQVNADATTNDQWQPVIAITPDGLKLHVSWYDRRLDPGNALFEVFGRNADVSGTTVTWNPEYRITDGPSPVVVGQDPAINTTYMSDYDQATADNTWFFRTWSDNRLSNSYHLYQPDVRSTRIPRDGPGPAITPGARTLTAESCTPANSAPDPNETVTMSFTVTNTGSTATSALVGTLQAGGGVTMPSAPQNFGAIAPGASSTQSFTFIPTGACGDAFTPSIQFQDGPKNHGTLAFAPVIMGAFGAPTTTNYSSGGVAARIPTAGTSGPMADQVINVAGSPGSITDVNVRLRLNHTWDGDLAISLISPNGTIVPLSTNRGGLGDNFGSGATDCTGTFTLFDDAAPTAIGSGSAPFTATSYMPETPLTAMNGGSPNGNWTLRINDVAAGDTGFLYCWQVEITSASFTCNPCTPAASANLSLTSSGSPSPSVTAGNNITYTYIATNNGVDPATDLQITTTTPANTTFVSASPSGGSTLVAQPGGGGTGAVTYSWIGATAVSGSRTLTMTVNVNGGTANGTTIQNIATTSSTTADPNVANNSAIKNISVGSVKTR